MSVPGVPAIRPSSTLMCMASSRVVMGLRHGILRHGTDLFVDTTEVNGRVRRGIAVAVNLHSRGADNLERGIGAECFQGRDLGPTRPAYPPGLLQNAGAQLAPAIIALGDIIVAAGQDHPGKGTPLRPCRRPAPARSHAGLPWADQGPVGPRSRP